MNLTSMKVANEPMPQSYGSFLKLTKKRKFLFLFGYSDYKGWWSKYVTGFTHMAAIELLDDNYAVAFEPLLSHCPIAIGTCPEPEQLKDWTVLEVDICPTVKNRLINAVFQTCATVIQYIAGISLEGCVLVQELYDTLMYSSKETLKRNGIVRVKRWDKQQR